MRNLNKRIKKLDVWDIALTKLAVVAFVVIILKLIPVVTGWLEEINILWFVVAWVIFSIRPFTRFWR